MRTKTLTVLVLSIVIVCRAQTVIGPCLNGACPAGSTCNTATNECVQSSPTTTSAPCVDLAAPGQVSDCPRLQYLCNNALYRALMAQQCPKTCGLCSGGSSTCVDLAAPGMASTCPSQRYLCTVPLYQALMRQQCPKTCGYC
ncbi:hypothetical protein Tcan_13994 [Toxocara canis]|uniref:ShKT domain-containing protein n=1 Tax=Toxocara canis TaxID=6265 RepID=A0A0B2VY67_TOXCA|nr:hypothetical protein Tcan_13994 [Toxocara canis]